MYEEFDTVVLKDGRIASLDSKDGPGVYTGTVDARISDREFKECGLS